MKFKTLAIAAFMMTLVACGGGDSGGDGDDLLTFTIILSANCSGKIRNADIFFDDRDVGRLTPGGSTNVQTTAGTHRIEARADTGATVGPIQRTIEFSGGSETLTCDSL